MFHYEGGKIGLLEAVRITLENDPNLRLQQEDVRLQEGVLEQLRGVFDWTLSGEASYQHREQELRRSTVQREQDRRDNLRDIQTLSCDTAAREDQVVAELQAASQVDSGVRITADPSLDTQLQLVETLIATTSDPTRQNQLRQTRLSIIDLNLRAHSEVAAGAHKQCIQAGEDLARLGKTPEFETFDNAQLSLRLDRLFRSGVAFAPFIDTSYDATQYVGKRNGYYVPRLDQNGNQVLSPSGIPVYRFIDFGGKNVEDLYKGEVGFEVNLPMGRGRGVDEVAAQEKAAAIDLDATAKVLKHGAAQSVLATTVAYWNLLAAQEKVAVVQRSADLQSQLVEITNQQINADQLPRSELSRVLASEARAKATVDSANRELVTARLTLARSMGLAVESEGNAPLATGPFPVSPPADQLAGLPSEKLAEQAVAHRYDRQAVVALVESGKVLARGARLAARPRLDIGASLSASAVGEKDYGKAVDKWVLPNWSLSASFEKPIGNRQRLGQRAQAEAQERQREISATDLERTIRISVVNALRSLDLAVARLARAEEAAQHYEETISAEVERLKFGSSTLIDTILTEQQRTGALLELLVARQQVAAFLAQLRYETGTLVSEAAGQSQVSEEALTSLAGLEPGS